MGINLYPSLLIECDSNDSCDDCVVGSVYVQPKNQYTNLSLINAIVDFNSVIRNNRDILSTIDSISGETIGRSQISAELYSKFTTVIDSTKNAISGLKEKIFLGIDQAIEKITAINNTSVDSLFKNYSIYEREKFLNRALARADISELSVRITDIACTPKLLQGTFPDFGLLKNVHLDHVNEACKYYTRGYNESYDIEEIKAFSNKDKEELEIISTRDDEDYDKTAPMKSTLFMAEKYFGDKSYHDTELSCELYRLACDNLEHSSRISQYISNRKVQYDDAFRRFMKCIDTVADSIYATFSKPDIDTNVSIEESYSVISTNIGRVLDTCLSSMQNIIDSNVILFSHKINKLISILQSSCRVTVLAHLLIQKYLPIEVNYDSNNASKAAYSDLDTSYDEIEDIVEECSIVISILNESYLEHSFNTTMMVLLEDDAEKKDEKKDEKKKDDKKSSSSDDDPTEGGKYSKFAPFRWIEKLWEAIKSFFKKLFGGDGEEGSASKATKSDSANAKLWNEIKADFEKGEWLEKNIPVERKSAIKYRDIIFKALEADCYVEFDVNSDSVKNRATNGGYKAALESEILKKLGYKKKPEDANTDNNNKNDNFSNLLDTALGTNLIDLSNYTKFSDIPHLKENLKTIVEFMQISFDTNSQYPNKYNVSNMLTKLNKFRTNFQNDYKLQLQKLEGTSPADTTKNDTAAKSESVIMMNDNENNFNLAECLGLYQNDIKVLFEDDNNNDEKKDKEDKEKKDTYQVTKDDANKKELDDLYDIWKAVIGTTITKKGSANALAFDGYMALVREISIILKNVKVDAYETPTEFADAAQMFNYAKGLISKFPGDAANGYQANFYTDAFGADKVGENTVPLAGIFEKVPGDESGAKKQINQAKFNALVTKLKEWKTKGDSKDEANKDYKNMLPATEALLKVLETPIKGQQPAKSQENNKSLFERIKDYFLGNNVKNNTAAKLSRNFSENMNDEQIKTTFENNFQSIKKIPKEIVTWITNNTGNILSNIKSLITGAQSPNPPQGGGTVTQQQQGGGAQSPNPPQGGGTVTQQQQGPRKTPKPGSLFEEQINSMFWYLKPENVDKQIQNIRAASGQTYTNAINMMKHTRQFINTYRDYYSDVNYDTLIQNVDKIIQNI